MRSSAHSRLLALLLVVCAPIATGERTVSASADPAVPARAQEAPQSSQGAPVIHPRVRPAFPIRLGGVFTLGLGATGSPFEESAAHATSLSSDNTGWLAQNCDVAALNAVNLKPETFRAMTDTQPLFTPLLYAYASSLFEQPNHEGNVGGWSPRMASLTLRDVHGKEAPYPEPGGHWMDFGSEAWAAHWRDQAITLVRKYGAQGVVAAEMPIDNTFVQAKLAHYTTQMSRAVATTNWLNAARAPGRYLLIPAAVGFDAVVGRTTLPLAPGSEAPALEGRLWNDTYPLVDGAWVEGWIRPYWSDTPLPEIEWERQIEAADRAALNDQVFIAAAAYRNADELEYALASYLLAAHRQGRFVFQPMPLEAGQRRDAGYSLAVMRREYRRWQSYFDAPIGPYAEQVRHLVPTEGGNVWKRSYLNGVVYVNSTDRRTMTIQLGSKMIRLSGKKVGQVVLPPHSGVVLIYDTQENGGQ